MTGFASLTTSGILEGAPGGASRKNPLANVGDIKDVGSVPGSGRSPGVENGSPLQYSCLENSIDRGAWWATVHGSAKATEHTQEHTPGRECGDQGRAGGALCLSRRGFLQVRADSHLLLLCSSRYPNRCKVEMKICMQHFIKINGKLHTDITYLTDFMDVISINKTGENFHLICDTRDHLLFIVLHLRWPSINCAK